MPYQTFPSYTSPVDQHNSARYYNNSSLLLTQQTSNVSQLVNHCDDALLLPTTIQPHTPTTNQPRTPTTIQPPTSPTTPSVNRFTYNPIYGCRTIITSKKSSCKSDQDYFKHLYCMYSGCEGNARSRITSLLDNKHSTLTIRSIKPVKKDSANELLRRYSYLMLKEKGVLVGTKNYFRPANKSQEEINILFKSPQFRLPSGEKLYLEFEMEEFISFHEKELKNRLDELQQQGSEITKSDLKKMRLWEAIFFDSKYMRDKLVKLKNNMSRQEIDARNSKVGPLSLYQLAAEKYNDKDWVAYTRIMPDLNEKFRSPIRLVLMPDEEEMTETAVKNAYTDAKGKMNVALANWKLSGNGKGNLKAKVKGLGYDSILGIDENDVTFVDDDRFNFVSQLHIAYFWSLCEVSGLTHHISQNCSSLNGEKNSTDTSYSSSTSGKVRGRNTTDTNLVKKQKVEYQTEALFAMVNDIKKKLSTSKRSIQTVYVEFSTIRC